jgi:hypothetical protein
MATDREVIYNFTVFARGPTGPYDVRLPIEIAAELLLTKELDIMQDQDSCAQELLSFSVLQLTQSGEAVERSHTRLEDQERRRQEARENARQAQHDKRKTDNNNTLRIYLEFDISHALASPGLRTLVEKEFETAVKGAFGSDLIKVNFHRPLDRYQTPKSCTTFFLHFHDIHLIKAASFITLKYRQVVLGDKTYKPIHTRIHASYRARFHFATCCYRPHCEGPKTCEIKKGAIKPYLQANRISLFASHEIPEWKAEKMMKREQEIEAAHQSAKRARNILSTRMCKKFALGMCSRGDLCAFAHPPPRAAMKLSMLTLNVGGLQDNKKLRNFIVTVRKWIKDLNIDILLIQEHNLHPTRELEIQRISKGLKISTSYAPRGTDGNHWGGVMTIFSENTINNIITLDEIPGSYLSTSFEWSDSTFKINNVYAPVRPSERLAFFNIIKTHITNDMIIGGD